MGCQRLWPNCRHMLRIFHSFLLFSSQFFGCCSVEASKLFGQLNHLHTRSIASQLEFCGHMANVWRDVLGWGCCLPIRIDLCINAFSGVPKSFCLIRQQWKWSESARASISILNLKVHINNCSVHHLFLG